MATKHLEIVYKKTHIIESNMPIKTIDLELYIFTQR